MTFDVQKEEIFNNVYLSYNGANKRNQEITFANNKFQNMLRSTNTFVEIQFDSIGNVYFTNNLLQNLS